MSRKPENTFISGVHRHMSPLVYAEKMANPYRGGTPDVWYSGGRRDLWCEYKYVELTPTGTMPITATLSALQSEWLRGRYKQGRNVCVIIGSPKGGCVLRKLEWEKPITRNDFVRNLKSRAELAAWIQNEVG